MTFWAVTKSVGNDQHSLDPDIRDLIGVSLVATVVFLLVFVVVILLLLGPWWQFLWLEVSLSLWLSPSWTSSSQFGCCLLCLPCGQCFIVFLLLCLIPVSDGIAL